MSHIFTRWNQRVEYRTPAKESKQAALSEGKQLEESEIP